jgi:SAM-dependent methyltransferase
MPGTGYFAADADPGDELARLRLIEAECDRHTFRHLDAIGVGEGWRCLEVGAGGGSIVRWLAQRVGPTGHVVAADSDPRFLGDLQESNIEVRRCDITRDDLEPNRYDLVHSRLLLMHVSDPADVLRRMSAAVRPGGFLIAEELDNGVTEALDPAHLLSEVFDRGTRKRIELARTAGIMDLRLGKALPGYMEALGLIEMGNEAWPASSTAASRSRPCGCTLGGESTTPSSTGACSPHLRPRTCAAPTGTRHSPTAHN